MTSTKSKSELPPPAEIHCPNCGVPFTDTYCSRCGEKRLNPEDYSLKNLFKQLVHHATSLDSRIARSLWLLLVKPGLLSREFLSGKRKKYVHPLKLFLLVNAIYFLVQPYSHVRGFNTNLYSHLNRQLYSPLARQILYRKFPDKNIPPSYRNRFNARGHTLARSLVFIMVFMFTLLVALLEARSRRYLIEHLIFSLHFYAFILFYEYSVFMAVAVPTLIFFHTKHIELYLSISSLLVTGTYLFFSVGTFYPQSRAKRLLKALVLTVGVFAITSVYRFVLFGLTFLLS